MTNGRSEKYSHDIMKTKSGIGSQSLRRPRTDSTGPSGTSSGRPVLHPINIVTPTEALKKKDRLPLGTRSDIFKARAAARRKYIKSLPRFPFYFGDRISMITCKEISRRTQRALDEARDQLSDFIRFGVLSERMLDSAALRKKVFGISIDKKTALYLYREMVT